MVLYHERHSTLNKTKEEKHFCHSVTGECRKAPAIDHLPFGTLPQRNSKALELKLQGQEANTMF